MKGAIWPAHLRSPDGQPANHAAHQPLAAAKAAERRMSDGHRFILRFRTRRRKARQAAASLIDRFGPEALAEAARGVVRAGDLARDHAADVYVEVKRRLEAKAEVLTAPL